MSPRRGIPLVHRPRSERVEGAQRRGRESRRPRAAARSAASTASLGERRPSATRALRHAAIAMDRPVAPLVKFPRIGRGDDSDRPGICEAKLQLGSSCASRSTAGCCRQSAIKTNGNYGIFHAAALSPTAVVVRARTPRFRLDFSSQKPRRRSFRKPSASR